ncbi:MAG: histidine kinase N-terminal 7TM domain-containing protein [candidate division KSB1 bacterium]|nr:histidine kinase N-terminal 7TM domain-containing protein [candidate division KSB1 bacterium]
MIKIGPYSFQVYSYVMLFGFFFAAFLTFYLRRYPKISARYMMWTEICVAQWSLAYVFESAATTVPLKLLWSQIAYVGTMGAPVFFFLFAVSYSQKVRFNWKSISLIALLPFLTVILAVTNIWHEWVWTAIIINPLTNLAAYHHGTWFWINTVYVYLLLLAGVSFLLSSIRHFARFYSLQSVFMILASLFPIIGNGLYLSPSNPVPGLEWTPLGFIISGAFVSLALFRYGMFDLVPVARSKVLDVMQDGVLVLDEQQRIVDMNSTLTGFFNVKMSGALGMPVKDIFPEFDPGDFSNCGESEVEKTIPGSEGDKVFTVKCAVLQSNTHSSGQLIVFRDITKRKQLEEERENLIVELQDALLQVKTLTGMLPICARCKKIRDDKGYWQSVEHYVQEHSDAVFSHGICPKCLSEMYPEYGEHTDPENPKES